MSFISHNSKKLFLQKKKAGKPASSSKWENQSSENFFYPDELCLRSCKDISDLLVTIKKSGFIKN